MSRSFCSCPIRSVPNSRRDAVSDRYDFLIIGSGPGGQKAAICAAKAGQRVALVEQDRMFGGACVHRGTIPSKTLRENAIRVSQLRKAANQLGVGRRSDIEMVELLSRLESVVSSYAKTVLDQLTRNGIECIHGRARLRSDHGVEVRTPSGNTLQLEAERIIIASGSRPRQPEGIPVDHEYVLDADSILSLAYLPQSLAVLGSGVIACEYASVFAQLGVEVTIVDRGERPLAFLDTELSEAFVKCFQKTGGSYLPHKQVAAITNDGVATVTVAFEDGESIEVEKVFVALGRTGCLEELQLDRVGLEPTPRGTLEVDSDGRTASPHIYAVGDIVGAPALATSAMEQGRRVVQRALGAPDGRIVGPLPSGIYTLPEIASVGASEAQVIESHGAAAVGRAHFDEVARGQISDLGWGLLKLVADPEGEQLLGVHIIGQGAADLVHIGQLAIGANAPVDDLVENVFNFPTMAEAYRIAALDLLNPLRVRKDREQ